MLKEWSFEDLGCHRAWLDAKDYNVRALHVYEKVGLKREDLLREKVLNGDKFENLVILSILDKKYEALKRNN